MQSGFCFSSSSLRFCAGWLVLLSVVMLVNAPHASARRRPVRVRVAVAAFSGADGMRDSVAEALTSDDRIEVVSDSNRADLIFIGEVQGRASRRVLVLRVLDMRNRTLAEDRVPLRSGSGRVDGVALRLLGDALTVHERNEAEAAPPPPREDARRDDSRIDTRSRDERDARDYRDRDERDRRPSRREERPYTVAAPIFTIAAGITARSRTVDIALSDGMRRRLSAWYPELHIFAELRPLANDQSLARGIFLRAEFAQEVGLSLRNDNSGTNFDPNFFRFLAHAGLLFPIENAVELGPDVGFGMDVYDVAANSTLPTAQYSYIRGAVRSRIRLVEETFVLDAAAALRVAIQRGELSDAFGAGGATVGLDVGGGFSGTFENGIFYTAHVHWINYWLSFSGEPNPAWNDRGYRIGGVNGIESSVRFTFALGYAFR